MTIKSTRQRILDLLSEQDQLTAGEISRALSVTQADVRYHLTRMEGEGLVLSITPKHSGRRGRPARRFNLVSKSKRDNFDLFTKALLDSIRQKNSIEIQKITLHEIADQIAGEINPAGPLGRRLMKAVKLLNQQYYQARWEAHTDAPRVIFDRCPFAALRPDYPELCHLDSTLLAVLISEDVVQIHSNAHQPDGFCLFNISLKSPGS
jgi:predicted ArsR family transcriptional regulator